ncbi:MAG: primosomal protein N' family DNA-binding protein, partial [bacterium]
MLHFIDVILPIPLERLFTYSVSEAEANFLKIGSRVAVPFGKSKIYTAIVANKHHTPPNLYEAKEIHQILDKDPKVTLKQLELWNWITKYYMCTLGEVMRAALPSAFLLESETQVYLNTESQVDENALDNEEFLVFEALQHQSSLNIDEISAILDKKNTLPIVKRLIDKNTIAVKEVMYEKYKPKLVRHVLLNVPANNQDAINELLDGLKRAPKQAAIVTSYLMISNLSNALISTKTLLQHSGASSAQLKSLIDKNIFEEQQVQEDRVQYNNDENPTKFTLSESQSNALNEINQVFKKQDVALLHGFTSSGKTELYIELIKNVLQNQEHALYLVPEIALTTQLVQRLERIFGDQIIVFHSRFSLN